MNKNDSIELILGCVAERMTVYLQENHISVEQQVDSRRLILNYLDSRNRIKSICPRAVCLSKELSEKIASQKIINDSSAKNKEITQRFEYILSRIKNGDDVKFYMSRKIFDSKGKNKDIMLNVWNVVHIHLSDIDTKSKRGMKKNRSEYLLFCIIDNKTVYCLDICKHPEKNAFFSYNLMNIIKNNGWMHLSRFEQLDAMADNVSNLDIKNDEELTAIYLDKKINIALEYDGKVFYSIEGINCEGDNLDNVFRLNNFQHFLRASLFNDDIVLQNETEVLFSKDITQIRIFVLRKEKKLLFEYKL